MKNIIMVLAVLFCGTVQKTSAQDGLIVCETWNNTTLADPQTLADNPTLLGAPTSTTMHANFDAPVNTAGTFVRRCRAQVKAPVVGNHTFWVASNGMSKLYLSTDQVYMGKSPIANMMRTVAPARNLYTRWPEQKSAVIPFASNTNYYLMLIYTDSVVEAGTNVNHASVKWMLPNGTQQGPIAGVNLKVPPALTTNFTFTASPTTVTSGGTTALNWSCNGTPTASATPVVASWTGVKPTSGAQGISVTANTTFSLSCMGPGGTTTINAPVTVSVATPAPTCTFAASPTSVSSGGQSTATWACSNASTTAVSNNAGLTTWNGAKAVSGSQAITFASTTTLTLVATGPGGTSPTYTVTVNVVPAPTCTFTASPTSVAANGATALTWNCSNSSTRTASNNTSLPTWTGSKNASGTASINVATTTIFTLVATNSVGVSVNYTVTVSVTGSTGNIRLYWDPNSESDLAGYVLVYGQASGVYTQSVTLGKTVNTHEFTGLPDGTYYFAARAFNSAGMHSGYSNEVRVILGGGQSMMSFSTEDVIWEDPMSTNRSMSNTASSNEPFTDSGSSTLNEVLLVKDSQDLWIEDPLQSGWRLESGWSWNQSDPKDPAVVLKKDWILSSAENKILPGPSVTQTQVLGAPQGGHYWTSLSYAPEVGYTFGGIRKPDSAGFISGTKLVWFYHIHISEGFAKFYPVAVVTMTVGNNGYTIYSRDERGKWLTTTTQLTGKFDLVLPDLLAWAKLQNVRSK